MESLFGEALFYWKAPKRKPQKKKIAIFLHMSFFCCTFAAAKVMGLFPVAVFPLNGNT